MKQIFTVLQAPRLGHAGIVHACQCGCMPFHYCGVPGAPQGLQGDALTCLAKCPRLRELSLAHNKVTSTPTIDAMAEATSLDHTEILAELVALDLAHNHIRSEKDIDDLTVLPKLEQLSLYGNPLLGATGEDPTGETVRTLVQTATQQRDGWTARHLDVTTEVPRKRPNRGTAGAAAGAKCDRRFERIGACSLTICSSTGSSGSVEPTSSCTVESRPPAFSCSAASNASCHPSRASSSLTRVYLRSISSQSSSKGEGPVVGRTTVPTHKARKHE